MSTATTARVRGVMQRSTLAGSMLKVARSMSANTGMPFQCRMQVAVAAMVQGVVMTSSPGSMPIAPTAASRPEVQEFTAMAWRTPK